MLSQPAVEVLSSLTYQSNAEWLVNVLPFGGVYWADEMPDIRQLVHCFEQDRTQIVRMFSLRLELWNAEGLSDDDQEFWDSIRAQAPTWPLFRRLELTEEQKRVRQKAEQQVAQEIDAPSDEQ